MKIANISPMIVRNYQNPLRRRRTIYLRGPSGVGKSEGIRQAATELANWWAKQDKEAGRPEQEFGYIDIRLAQMDPVEFGGLPSVEVDAEGHRWSVKNPPNWLPRPGTRGIILLDELSSAPPAQQAVAYQFALDRKFGDTPLPDEWMVIAAGNRQSDRGVVFPLAAPLLARMTVIDVESSVDNFIDYCGEHGVRGEIIAFIKQYPQYLNERDEKVSTDMATLGIGDPFATQRAWVQAAQYYIDDPDEIRLEQMMGAVGKRAATDFEAFLRIWETMPSIDAILTDPDSVPQPKDSSVRYAVTVGVALRMTAENMGTAMRYIGKMPAEFQVLCVKLAYKKDKDISECQAFTEVVVKHADVFKRGK